MKFTRKASAQWKGSGKEGSGTLSSESGVLERTPYSFNTRFTDAGGTNPEELIGAALGGCFAMQLSFLIGEEGYTPDSLDASTEVLFQDGAITHIQLNLKGKVPGMDADAFAKTAQKAKEVCPISKLLDTEITLDARLNE